jgi:heme oxygenase
VPTEITVDQPFSTAIRAATASAHRDAERSTFLADLVGGALAIEGYGRLVAQHRAIYEALEGSNDAMGDDPVAGTFVQQDVVRLPALERDIVAVLGEGWAARPEAALVPATVEYCERLREVGGSWPGGWVAHQYVRYLGDLSGGLFIRMRIEAVFGIDAGSGTAFYDFPQVPDPAAWKDAYRRRLDEAPWPPEERERITAEILESYRLNTLVLEQLGA